MTVITDFYQYKYGKKDCYMDLLVNRDALLIIEEALNERLSNLHLTKDYQCAYMRLKELFQSAREITNTPYIQVKINKCYVKYIKNLSSYFNERYEYIPLQILNEYLQVYSRNDIGDISQFSILNEDIKVRILSNI